MSSSAMLDCRLSLRSTATLAPQLSPGGQFSQVGMDRRNVLENTEVAVMASCGNVVSAEFVGLAKAAACQ